MLGRSAAVAGAAALLASLADLAAASIEVDEEGVMHNRGGLVEARDFDLKKLKAVHSGTHDQADVGSSYRIHYHYDGCAACFCCSFCAAPDRRRAGSGSRRGTTSRWTRGASARGS